MHTYIEEVLRCAYTFWGGNCECCRYLRAAHSINKVEFLDVVNVAAPGTCESEHYQRDFT